MSLVYRGTSSDDVKFNVTERRVYNAPAFDVTGIEVPGRSGDVLNSQERFKNKSIVYTGFIRSSDFPGDTTWERLSRGLRTIKAWVCGDAGKYHDLTDDYDPGFVRRAFVSGETAISEVLDRPDGATITITFMAEPFMYEESDPIELPETGTASGAIASFEGVAAPLQSLKFNIEPQQSGSGDPSPSNIRPISGWSQVDAVAAGKNLAVLEAIGAINLSTGELQTSSSSTYARTGKVKCLPNTAYAISGGWPITQFILGYYDANDNYLGYAIPTSPASGVSSITFTTHASASYVVVIVRRSANTSSLSDFPQFQFEEGSVASPYAAPAITPITIQLGQTVYGGTVDAIEGKLTITHGYTELSSLSWSRITNGTIYIFDTVVADFTPTATNTDAFLSTYYTPMPNTAGYGLQSGQCARGTGGKHLYVRDDTYTTAAAFKTAGAGKYICYKLATPIEVDLTLVSVSSLLGQNNIWASCGDTEVVYVEPTENPTEWPSKPRLEITMSGAGTLTVNGKTWSIGAYTGTLICDSEIMDWYDASNLKNSLVSGDGFPELQPGENVITYTGGITKVVAKPRWRTL